MSLTYIANDVRVTYDLRIDAHRYKKTSFGSAVRVPGSHGYVAYAAKPIPRNLELTAATVRLLAEAESALGQLAGVGRLLPNPDLLANPYLLREALSSTRIEGTQASIAEVLENRAAGEEPNADIEEVLNYVGAMRAGVGLLDELPISARLVRRIHGELMQGVRGEKLSPGELRTSQNWIGPPEATIESALFVPPPPEQIGDLLSDWEHYANTDAEVPVLIQNALLHAQFETIHPFLDGNGRLGRLLIVFFLIARGKLPAPMLYVSSHFEGHRERYYEALQAIREQGDPEPWFELFLEGIASQASDAVSRAHRILQLRERYREAAGATNSPNALGLVDLICANPILTARAVEKGLDVSRPTALRLLKRMESEGLITASEQGSRGQRRYLAHEMYEVISGVGDD